MKFRNPWIDPRIGQVTPEAAQAYLTAQGWSLAGPAANPVLLMYQRPENGDEPPTVLVPVELDEGPMLQRMIDLVAELARIEDRWAVDVLGDILAHESEVKRNGPMAPRSAAPAPK